MAVWRKSRNASDGRRSLRALRYALFLILTAPAWCQDSPTAATDEQVTLWFETARQAHAEGDLPRATAEYEKVLRVRPEIAEMHSNLGHAMAHGALGRAYMLAGRPDQAVEMLERSVKLDPGDRKTRYQLAIIYRREGRKEEADRELAAFRKLSQQETNELGHLQQESLFDSAVPDPED